MDQPVGIDFECGVSVSNVGEIGMALRHHLTVCDDPSCVKDVNDTLAKYGYAKSGR